MSDFLSTAIGLTEFDGDELLVSGSFFETFDPAHVRFAQWVKAAIIAELNGKGWAEAVAGSSLEGAEPVGSLWLWEPDSPTLKQVQVQFPLLSVWPVSEVHGDETLSIETVTTSWSLQYALGPLSPELYRKIGGAMRGFTKLLKALLYRKAHPAFDDGAVQIHHTKLNWSTVRTVSARYGRTLDNDGMFMFYGAHVVLETMERVSEIEDDSYAELDELAVSVSSLGPTLDDSGPGAAVAFAEDESTDLYEE